MVFARFFVLMALACSLNAKDQNISAHQPSAVYVRRLRKHKPLRTLRDQRREKSTKAPKSKSKLTFAPALAKVKSTKRENKKGKNPGNNRRLKAYDGVGASDFKGSTQLSHTKNPSDEVFTTKGKGVNSKTSKRKSNSSSNNEWKPSTSGDVSLKKKTEKKPEVQKTYWEVHQLLDTLPSTPTKDPDKTRNKATLSSAEERSSKIAKNLKGPGMLRETKKRKRTKYMIDRRRNLKREKSTKAPSLIYKASKVHPKNKSTKAPKQGK